MLTLELESLASMPLHAFSELLRAAPAFQRLYTQTDICKPSLTLECDLLFSTGAELAADLAFLLTKSDLPAVRNAKYRLDISERNTDESLLPEIACLPVMSGVAQLELVFPLPAELGALLRVFPNATELTLAGCTNMTDVELQCLAVHAKLTHLRLLSCAKVTPMGLFALCQRLPQLLDVSCQGCALLGDAALKGCVQLLRQHSSLARLVQEVIGQ